MRLDKSQDEDCRSRFVYASRSWVLRAIYEGLIPPVFILAVTILIKYFHVWKGWCESFNEWQSDWTNKVILPWGENAIVGILGAVVMTFVAYIIVKLLAREARRCANTQIREVIVAYYHFIEDRKQESLRESDVQQNAQVMANHNLSNKPLCKFINWLKRI